MSGCPAGRPRPDGTPGAGALVTARVLTWGSSQAGGRDLMPGRETRGTAPRRYGVMRSCWYVLRADRYGSSTRRHTGSACARITGARKMGSHGNPDVTAEVRTWAATQARTGEDERLRPGPTSGAAHERRRSERDVKVRQTGGDPRRLVLRTASTGGDVQSVLARKSGSPRPAGKLRGRPGNPMWIGS